MRLPLSSDLFHGWVKKPQPRFLASGSLNGHIGKILVSIATASSLCRTAADVNDRLCDRGLIKILPVH